MTPEEADAALTRELRYRAKLEHQRRYLIERVALIVERACDKNLSDSFHKKANSARIMRLANRVRALAQETS